MKLFALSYLLLCIPYLFVSIVILFQLQTVKVEGRNYVYGFGDYKLNLSRLRIFMTVYSLACAIFILTTFNYSAYVFMLFFEALVVTVSDCVHYLSGKTGSIDRIRYRFIQMITVTERPTREPDSEKFSAILNAYPDGIRLRACLVASVFVPALLILGSGLTCVLVYNLITH